MQRNGRRVALVGLLLWVASLSGCATYVTPKRGADLRAIGLSAQTQEALTDASVRRALDKQPLARFPTSLAVVRIQAAEYYCRTVRGWGTGRYSIVMARDVETEAQFERLARLPKVTGLARLNKLLFASDELNSDLELRNAAAHLHADMLLIYTLDTTFTTDDVAVPLTVITLGLSPNKVVRATTTASAVFVGTRNGYVYGIAEVTRRNDRIASAWTDSQAIDNVRRKTESQAFEMLVAELGKTWTDVVRRYGLQAARSTEKTAMADARGGSLSDHLHSNVFLRRDPSAPAKAWYPWHVPREGLRMTTNSHGNNPG